MGWFTQMLANVIVITYFDDIKFDICGEGYLCNITFTAPFMLFSY